MHVIGVDAGGHLWHTICHGNGSWQPRFGSIEGQESNDLGAFSRVRCAGVGGDLHVCALVKPTVAFL